MRRTLNCTSIYRKTPQISRSPHKLMNPNIISTRVEQNRSVNLLRFKSSKSLGIPRQKLDHRRSSTILRTKESSVFQNSRQFLIPNQTHFRCHILTHKKSKSVESIKNSAKILNHVSRRIDNSSNKMINLSSKKPSRPRNLSTFSIRSSHFWSNKNY